MELNLKKLNKIENTPFLFNLLKFGLNFGNQLFKNIGPFHIFVTVQLLTNPVYRYNFYKT